MITFFVASVLLLWKATHVQVGWFVICFCWFIFHYFVVVILLYIYRCSQGRKVNLKCPGMFFSSFLVKTFHITWKYFRLCLLPIIHQGENASQEFAAPLGFCDASSSRVEWCFPAHYTSYFTY